MTTEPTAPRYTALDPYAADAEAFAATYRPDPDDDLTSADFLPVIAAALLAIIDRLDAAADALAGVTAEMKATASGGLLGLLTGKRP